MLLVLHSVLDDFEEVKVAAAYSHKGNIWEDFSERDFFKDLEVVYETLSGWKQSTAGVRSYGDLPHNARKYAEFIEDFVSKGLREVEVKYIGTGKLVFSC